MTGLGNIDDVYKHYLKVVDENEKLKELLRECRDGINPYIEVIGGKKTFKNLIDKISEV